MNFEKKILPNLIIIALLTPTTIYFLDIIFNQQPNVEISSKSYEKKMEYFDPYIYRTLNYIRDSVESNSTVLFFHYNFYILGKGFLYPEVKAKYTRYVNDDTLLIYLQNNIVHYIIIIRGPHHLASNTNLFTKIEYYPQIYLLKINRSAL